MSIHKIAIIYPQSCAASSNFYFLKLPVWFVRTGWLCGCSVGSRSDSRRRSLMSSWSRLSQKVLLRKLLVEPKVL